jgi:hypothetical protein
MLQKLWFILQVITKNEAHCQVAEEFGNISASRSTTYSDVLLHIAILLHISS